MGGEVGETISPHFLAELKQGENRKGVGTEGSGQIRKLLSKVKGNLWF